MEAVSIVPGSGSNDYCHVHEITTIRTKPQSRSINCQEAVAFPKDFFFQKKSTEETEARPLPLFYLPAPGQRHLMTGSQIMAKTLNTSEFKRRKRDVLRCSWSIWMTAFQAFKFDSKEFLASSDERLCSYMSHHHHYTSFWPPFPGYFPGADAGSWMSI